jgi:hypothetical protein
MSGHWEKLGQLFDPDSAPRHPKLATHAANPVPVLIRDDVYRVFYSGRDVENRSSVGAVDIDILKQRIIQEFHDPFFVHGPKDSFYSEGVSIGCTLNLGDRMLMYFMGWKNQSGHHWYGEVGALEIHHDLTLSLAETEPILGLSAENPISLSYPWICCMADGSYLMWFGSTIEWNAGNGEMLHIIKSATSSNGQVWKNFDTDIPHVIGRAQAFSRPSVWAHDDGSFDMWFSYRSGNGTPYRIGRATSSDAKHWELKLDHAGIDVSISGWDADMIEYPFVFNHKGQTYMLYNGNGYGRSGFGLALWCQ